MLKKIVLGSAIAGAGALLLFGTAATSYVRTSVGWVQQSVKDSVHILLEIKRARQMISDLKPEIASNMRVIAREEVEVARLASQVKEKQELIAKSRDDIMRLKDDLQSGSSHFVYAGRSFSSKQVRDDLANRFDQFKTQEATVTKLEQVLEARELNLNGARRKLEGMLAAKRQLEVEVENLQARQTMVEVAQTSSEINLDNSQLAQTRDLLDEIRTRIDVAERLIDSEGIMEGSIPLDEEAPADLLDKISDYFGDGRQEVEALVSLQQ